MISGFNDVNDQHLTDVNRAVKVRGAFLHDITR